MPDAFARCGGRDSSIRISTILLSHMNYLKNTGVLCFIGGVLAAALGRKVVKSQVVRKVCVKGIAAGMRMKQDAQEAFVNMKEEARDLCYEAEQRNLSEEKQ